MVRVGFRRWAVLLGAVNAEVRPVAYTRPDICVRLVILFAPALVVAGHTVHQRALLHFARFAVVQVVACAATSVLVARAMTITLVTPNRHSTFAHLEMSVLTVCHTPREDRGALSRCRAPLILACLAVVRKRALTSSLFRRRCVFRDAFALAIALVAIHLWALLALASHAMVAIVAVTHPSGVIASAMSGAGLGELREVEASRIIVRHFIVGTSLHPARCTIALLDVAAPRHRTPLQFAHGAEEWIAAATSAGVVRCLAFRVGNGNGRVYHEIDTSGVARDTVAIQIAHTAIEFWAALERTVFSIPQVLALADTHPCVAVTVAVALQLPVD